MSWIKRNLYFVIGAVVAVILLGVAGWYFYSKWSLNDQNLNQLNQAYSDLVGFNKQSPHPGSGSVNNIQLAKEQQQELKAYIDKARHFFQKIEPIPNVPKLTDRDFSAALSRSIDQLRRDAAAASVSLPPDYSFSFQSQRQKVTFHQNSLSALAVELGEVRAICNVLFQAKVNSLDSLHRERTEDDASGNATDYLVDKSVTNELAVVSPYEISFRSFSPELASVLAGFAGSQNGLVVKTINVENPGVTVADNNAPPGTAPAAAPVYVPPAPAAPTSIAAADALRRRYSPDGTPAAAAAPAPQAPVASAPAPAKGLPIVLDEKQLKVTITLEVIKPLPSATGK